MPLEVQQSVDAVEPDSLGDALSVILDKGLVIAGDISIHLVKTELLTIKVRLLLASVQRAEEMGIDWWKRDQFLSGPQADEEKLLDLGETIENAFATSDVDAVEDPQS